MSVLDASALLAWLGDEPGAEVVEHAIAQQAAISAANWAEALSTLANTGRSPIEVESELARTGLFGHGLVIEPLDAADAQVIAQLRPVTKHLGLSLGDRACLALGLGLSRPILTTDSAFEDVVSLVDDLEVRLIR
jgi:PIN domain nuclease of toxin-antitoxin system